jgi:lipopolysaccharide biosynthesis glycosyltransferase
VAHSTKHTIAIVHGTDTYFRLPVLISIAAIARASAHCDAHCDFHIITDQTDPTFENALSIAAAGHSTSVHVLNTAHLEGRLHRYGRLTHSLGTYFRFFVGELLPANLHRVLYIDGDAFPRCHLGELWSIDLAGAVVAAAPDFPGTFEMWGEETCRRFGVGPRAPYFNAGVMLIDLAAWRRQDVGRKAFAFHTEHGKSLPY